MCERTGGLRLRAGRRFACVCSLFVSLSRLALVRYCLACGSGFHSPARFASSVCRRVSFVCVEPRPRFAPVFSCPVRFLLRPCFPPPVSSVGFGRLVVPAWLLVLTLTIAWRCRVIPSVWCLASPRRRRPSASRPLCSARLVPSSRRASSFLSTIVGLLASLVLVACGFVAVLPSCGLTPFRPSPRLACRRTERLGVPFLVVARSSVAGRLAPCQPPVFLACFPASVSCGMAVGGGVPRCPCVPLACYLLPRLGSCVGGVGVSCLRVACSRYAYRPVPHIEERSDISRFDCSFSFFPIRR